MKTYVVRRIAQGLIVLFVVSAAIFVIVHSAPGGPALLNQPDMDPTVAKEMRQSLGLDDPIPVQYARWLRNALTGHFGKSYQHSIATADLMVARIPNTLLLSGTALVLAVLLALPLGTISAVYRYSWLDYLATVVAFAGVSIPVFWLGILMIILFSVTLGWLPSAGMVTIGTAFSVGDLLVHLVMPAVVLATFPLAQLTRYVRASMVDVLAQDYIRTARAKGLPEAALLGRHALRNALIPMLTVLGVLTPRLLGGAVITETIFAWPGLGRLAVDAAITRDYPVIMGVTLLVSAFVVVSNLVTDLLYGVVDPRITLQ
ncbi:MAG: ABC transporter permease [Candidatus Rokubacteria bacterium]|nr:ABC transporter permease [Candidatus Rokubacteria bacterium]